jgi:Zn-dependent protease with chaperone function
MHPLVYLPLVMPALAAATARPLAERLPPRTATWLLAGSSIVLAAASCAVLGLVAMAAVMRLPQVAALGGMSLRAVDRSDPASLPLGVLAGSLFAVAATSAVRACWLRVSALVSAHREARELGSLRQTPDASSALVVTDDRVDAYTVPGWPSRIVVTSGMLDALAPAEREVLLAHERAHVSARHYLFTAVARMAAAANPLLVPLARGVAYSVERWADERAAAETGSRPLAARTVAKAALAASAAPARRPASASVLGVLPARAAGLVPRRVAALLRPPPRRGLALIAVTVALLAVSCLSALDVATDLHNLIEMAQAAAVR